MSEQDPEGAPESESIPASEPVLASEPAPASELLRPRKRGRLPLVGLGVLLLAAGLALLLPRQPALLRAR